MGNRLSRIYTRTGDDGTTGLGDGTRSEVVSGLDGSEFVVKANVAALVDGQPVEPVGPGDEAAKKVK